MDTELSSKVVLKVKDELFHCDRKLLAKESPYFHAMFTNDFKEKHQELVTLKVLCRYMKYSTFNIKLTLDFLLWKGCIIIKTRSYKVTLHVFIGNFELF